MAWFFALKKPFCLLKWSKTGGFRTWEEQMVLELWYLSLGLPRPWTLDPWTGQCRIFLARLLVGMRICSYCHWHHGVYGRCVWVYTLIDDGQLVCSILEALHLPYGTSSLIWALNGCCLDTNFVSSLPRSQLRHMY